ACGGDFAAILMTEKCRFRWTSGSAAFRTEHHMNTERIPESLTEPERREYASQRDQAYHRIRRLLILQHVAEGERLREAHGADRLGVNRTALREAFARLEA